MAGYECRSFSAGQRCGTRTAACVARLAALELIHASHWWNRRRHRQMARALVACAEEMELAADEGEEAVPSGPPVVALTPKRADAAHARAAASWQPA